MKTFKQTAYRVFVLITIVVAIVTAFVLIKLWMSFKEGQDIESMYVTNVVAQDTINDAAQEGLTPTNLASGDFTRVDTIHKASGGVEVYEIGGDVYIRLGEDFQVTQGPDLYLYLSGPQEYGGAMGASIENTLNLGKLYRSGGEQVYKVSQQDWEKYNHSILIWCRAFGVHFSHALLMDS